MCSNYCDDNPVSGLVIHRDSIKNTSRLWLLNNREIETDKLQCKIGDWFTCTKIGDDWNFEESEDFLETRVDGWRVEVKVHAMMYRSCVDDLDISTQVKLSNTLFSPVLGRIGVFLNANRFSDGVLYQIWATYVPTEYEQCRKIRASSGVLWMVGNQQPLRFIANSNLETNDDRLVKMTGVVIKVISNTLVIKSPNVGICIAPIVNETVKRGDQVEVVLVASELTSDKRYLFAANCTTICSNYVDFVNDFDNEFRLKFVPKAEEFESGKFDVSPYNTINDPDRLIKPISAGKFISAVVRFRFLPEAMSVEFKFKEAVNVKQAADLPKSSKCDESEASRSKFDKRPNRNEFGDPLIAKDDPTFNEPTNAGTTAFRMTRTPRSSEVYVNGKRYQYDATANGTSFKSGASANTTAASTSSNGMSQTSGEPRPAGSSTSVNGATNHEDIGVVAAQTVDGYYVHCPQYPRDVFLPKTLPKFLIEGRAMNVGQWIKFVAHHLGSSDRMIIQSFKFTDPLFPTMPSFNTIIIECYITIPDDYNPPLYNGTVKSEFAPVVGDQDSLIRECHHGKTLLAVMRHMKTAIPNVFWNLEYIKF